MATPDGTGTMTDLTVADRVVSDRPASDRTREVAYVQVPHPVVGRIVGLLALCGAAGAVAAVVVGMRDARMSHVDGVGLLAALTLPAIIGFSALGVLIAVVLAVRPVPQWIRLAHLVALVVALDLAPVLLEPLPHFATAWVHAGYADYIERTGHILVGTDARFSWPGFFGATGLLAQAIGVPTLTLVRWASLVLDLLVLLPVSGILRTFVSDARQRSVGLLLFVLGNWVGQSYFAPQGVTYLLYLTGLLLVLRLLSSADPDGRPGARLAALVATVLLLAAAVVSHQLTPFFLLFALAALVALGRAHLGWLVALLAAMILAYFVWGAQDFWTGHLRGLLDDLGSFGRTVRTSVLDRASAGPDLQRRLVLTSRVVLPALVGLIALVGLSRARSRSLVTPAVLAVVPVLVLGLQSYGGEAALRVYLFSLPWLVVLGAHALVRAEDRRVTSGWLLVGTPVVVLVLLGLFGSARYGNEDFEMMRPADRQAVSFAYGYAQPGADLYVLSESVPWRDREVERFRYTYAPTPLDQAGLDHLLDTIAAEKVPSLLILTDGQWRELHEFAGLSDTQVAQVQDLVRSSPRLDRLYGSGDVGVYRVRGAAG